MNTAGLKNRQTVLDPTQFQKKKCISHFSMRASNDTSASNSARTHTKHTESGKSEINSLHRQNLSGSIFSLLFMSGTAYCEEKRRRNRE